MTKKHVHTGYLEDLSDEQRVVLDRLRQHLREELANNDPRYDDRYLLRFCRARKFDYPKVQLMFDNFLKWRETNGVDNIAEMDISKIKESAELLPHNYYCLDRKGRPVYIERYGKFDLKEITKVALFDQIVDEQFLLRYYIYAYERLLHVVFPEVTKRNNGTVIEQSVTILDLDGLAFTKILSKRNEIQQFLKLTSGIAQDNYPEIMGKLFIINAPFLFSMLWSVVKSFLDEKTANKIQIIGRPCSQLGGSYKKDLLKEISEEELPVFFGGKNATTLQDGCFKDLFQYRSFIQKGHRIQDIFHRGARREAAEGKRSVGKQPKRCSKHASSETTDHLLIVER
jgi:hypothetical protein